MASEKRLCAGLNGLGRFGLNLLWSWWNDPNAPYYIRYINDEALHPNDMERIILSDPLVQGFKRCKVKRMGPVMIISDPSGRSERITVGRCNPEELLWLGKPDIWLECSGRLSSSADLTRPFVMDDTKVAIVSATCHDADATLLTGFNHSLFIPERHKVVSYGSCTVNPGVLLMDFFHRAFSAFGCSVNVIHNVQAHRLSAGEFHTLQRKACTLESMAPKLLPWLDPSNFTVDYTVVPWEGVSVIDFAFRCENIVFRQDVVSALNSATEHDGGLYGKIGMIVTDTGPEVHVGSTFSAVVVEDQVRVAYGDTVRIFCYFYNEGSAIRMHELTSHVSEVLMNKYPHIGHQRVNL